MKKYRTEGQKKMKIRNRILPGILLLIVVLLVNCGYTQATTEKTSLEKVPEEDYLQKMIELVVEANPTLQAQRNLIYQIEAIAGLVKGPAIALNLKTGATIRSTEEWKEGLTPTASIELSIPLYSSEQRRKTALDKLSVQKDITKAWQDYYSFKNSIISDLLAGVDDLVSLKNEINSQRRLLTLLQHNLESLKKQVEAGVARPTELWAVSERMIATEMNICNLSSKVDTLERETALNLAGARWRELLEMLDEIGSQEHDRTSETSKE